VIQGLAPDKINCTLPKRQHIFQLVGNDFAARVWQGSTQCVTAMWGTSFIDRGCKA